MPSRQPTPLSLPTGTDQDQPASIVKMPSLKLVTDRINGGHGALHPTISEIRDQIETDVDTVVTYMADGIKDKTIDSKAGFETWQDGILRLYSLASMIFGINSEMFGLCGKLVNQGSIGQIAAGMSALLPHLVVFEYNHRRDADLSQIERWICGLSNCAEDYGEKSFKRMMPVFDEIRTAWKANAGA